MTLKAENDVTAQYVHKRVQSGDHTCELITFKIHHSIEYLRRIDRHKHIDRLIPIMKNADIANPSTIKIMEFSLK